MAQTVKEVLARFNGDDSGFKRAATSVKNESRGVQGAISSLNSMSLGKLTASIGALTGGFFTIKAALVSLPMKVMETAGTFEKYRVVLENTIKDQKKVNELFEWLQKLAPKAPFTFEELSQASVKLQTYGIKAQDVLVTLGDTAASMGKPLSMAVEALADGMMGEFERLKEFGLKVVQSGSKSYVQYVKSTGEVVKREIDRNNPDLIKSVLLGIWNEKYKNGMEKLSHTWTGLMSNMEDAATAFFNKIGKKGIFERMQKELAGFLTTLDEWENDGTLDKIAQSISDVMVAILDTIKYLIKMREELLAIGKVWATIWAVGKIMPLLKTLGDMSLYYKILRMEGVGAMTALSGSVMAVNGASVKTAQSLGTFKDHLNALPTMIKISIALIGLELLDQARTKIEELTGMSSGRNWAEESNIPGMKYLGLATKMYTAPTDQVNELGKVIALRQILEERLKAGLKLSKEEADYMVQAGVIKADSINKVTYSQEDLNKMLEAAKKVFAEVFPYADDLTKAYELMAKALGWTTTATEKLVVASGKVTEKISLKQLYGMIGGLNSADLEAKIGAATGITDKQKNAVKALAAAYEDAAKGIRLTAQSSEDLSNKTTAMNMVWKSTSTHLEGNINQTHAMHEKIDALIQDYRDMGKEVPDSLKKAHESLEKIEIKQRAFTAAMAMAIPPTLGLSSALMEMAGLSSKATAQEQALTDTITGLSKQIGILTNTDLENLDNQLTGINTVWKNNGKEILDNANKTHNMAGIVEGLMTTYQQQGRTVPPELQKISDALTENEKKIKMVMAAALMMLPAMSGWGAAMKTLGVTIPEVNKEVKTTGDYLLVLSDTGNKAIDSLESLGIIGKGLADIFKGVFSGLNSIGAGMNALKTAGTGIEGLLGKIGGVMGIVTGAGSILSGVIKGILSLFKKKHDWGKDAAEELAGLAGVTDDMKKKLTELSKTMKDSHKAFKELFGELLSSADIHTYSDWLSWAKEFNSLLSEALSLVKDINDQGAGGGTGNRKDKDKPTRGADDYFPDLGGWKKDLKQAQSDAYELDDAFQTLVKRMQELGIKGSQAIYDIIIKSRELKKEGIVMPNVTAYVKDMIGSAAEGLNKFMASFRGAKDDTKALSDAEGEYNNKIHDMEVGIQDLEDKIKSGTLSTEEMADATKELTDLQKELEDTKKAYDLDPNIMALREKVLENTKNIKANWNLMLGAAMATFKAMKAEGYSTIDILAKMGPTFTDLMGLAREYDLPVPKGLQDLMQISEYLSNNTAIADRLSGLTQLIEGLGNAAYLSADDFAVFGAGIKTTYEELVKSLKGQGYVNAKNLALQMMVPNLQALAKAAENSKTPLDEYTQSLIDAAKAAGLWTEAPPDTSDVVAGIEGVTAAINALQPGFAGITSAITALAGIISTDLVGALKTMASTATTQSETVQTNFINTRNSVLGFGDAITGVRNNLAGLGSDFKGQNWKLDFNIEPPDLPHFAEGGEFRVGRSRGGDRELIQFLATAGETVEVKTPGQQAQSQAVMVPSRNTVINFPITQMDGTMIDYDFAYRIWQAIDRNIAGVRTRIEAI
jgi:phage tail tape-measure protein